MGGIAGIRGIGGIAGAAGAAGGAGAAGPCWVAGGNRAFVAAGGLVSAVDGGGGCRVAVRRVGGARRLGRRGGLRTFRQWQAAPGKPESCSRPARRRRRLVAGAQPDRQCGAHQQERHHGADDHHRGQPAPGNDRILGFRGRAIGLLEFQRRTGRRVAGAAGLRKSPVAMGRRANSPRPPTRPARASCSMPAPHAVAVDAG